MTAIPVIDLKLSSHGTTPENRDRIAGEIAKHCTQVGFFVVHDHGIPVDLMESVREQARSFFDLSDAEKEASAIASDGVHRGYARINAEQIDPDGPQDFRESFLIGWERPDGSPLPSRVPLLGPNQWPENAGAEFRPTLKAYYARAMETAQFLLTCFARSLEQEPNAFAGFFSNPLTNLVLAHYPVMEGASDNPVLGCGEHTDYGLITLLMHDGVAGLQVRTRAGEWLDAYSSRDDLIVNVGDMMEFLSGGRYISNPHRVQVMRNERRFSMPFFVQPDYTSLIQPVLEPLEQPEDRERWKPRLGGAYIEERYNATFPSAEERALKKLKALAPGIDDSDTLGKVAQLVRELVPG